LNLTNDPLAFALLGQDPTQPSIIGSPPEDKVAEEKSFRHRYRQPKEQEDLESEQCKTEDVEVRFMIRGVKQGAQNIMGGRDFEDWIREG
jgi:hypothetical protein